MRTDPQLHVENARSGGSGRSAATLYKGDRLSQTIVALAAGTELSEHDNPGEATAQVLTGAMQVLSGGDVIEGTAGDLLVIPQARHSVRAVSDCAFLLTSVRD